MPTWTSDPVPGTIDVPHLFCFGLGYSARTLARQLIREGWRVSGTCREAGVSEALSELGVRVYPFGRDRPINGRATVLEGVTDLLSSVPPDAAGDTVLDYHAEDIARLRCLRWVGYLSTTGVYGDTGGEIVDETAPLAPTSERSRRRVAAEDAWRGLSMASPATVHVFRLAGIYGPGRSVFDTIRSGRAHRIDRPGHAFSRIHVDDIATVLRASIAQPEAGQVFNVCDDAPIEPAEVTAYACDLLDVEPPPLQPFDQAAATMSPMALSFWQDNRKVSNARIKTDLGVRLAHPDYRSGLAAILAAERRDSMDKQAPIGHHS